MNERNVAALMALLDEGYLLANETRMQAEFLAANGVLVPSALTDEQAEDLIYDNGYIGGTEGYESIDAAETKDIVAYLERIAKGEP